MGRRRRGAQDGGSRAMLALAAAAMLLGLAAAEGRHMQQPAQGGTRALLASSNSSSSSSAFVAEPGYESRHGVQLRADPPHPFTMVGQLDNGCSGFLVGETAQLASPARPATRTHPPSYLAAKAGRQGPQHRGEPGAHPPQDPATW
jgi:hypothetical protein